MKSVSWSRRSLLALSTTVGMFFMTGCEQNPTPAAVSPLQPSSTSASTQTLARISYGGQERGRSRLDRRLRRTQRSCEGTVTEVMGRRGGMLEFCGHGMQVPWGALSERREMSITILPSDKVEVGFALPNLDFGADGWFNKPVTLMISFADADLSGMDLTATNLTVEWFDEATQEWVDIGGEVNWRMKHVKVDVWHFTQYSLSAR